MFSQTIEGHDILPPLATAAARCRTSGKPYDVYLVSTADNAPVIPVGSLVFLLPPRYHADARTFYAVPRFDGTTALCWVSEDRDGFLILTCCGTTIKAEAINRRPERISPEAFAAREPRRVAGMLTPLTDDFAGWTRTLAKFMTGATI